MANYEPEEVMSDERYLHQITLRQYQVELIDASKKQNTIIFLPTGSGKTFIAVQVLRSRMKDLMMPVDKGGKICVFLGTTKMLVNQLAEVIKESTNLRVRLFLGEMGIDSWTIQTWLQETAGAQVLVMVPAIFLIIIQRSIVRLDKVSLIVFDECHHAVLNHPYRQIMREIDSIPEMNRPLIMGLTATVLNSNPTNDNFVEVNMLKKTLNSNFAKTDQLEEAMRYGTSPKNMTVIYDSSQKSNAEVLMEKLITTSYDRLEYLRIGGIAEDRAANIVPQECILLAKKNVIVKEIKNIFKHVERSINDLGLYPTSIVALYYYIRLERLKLMKIKPAAITAIKYALTVLNLVRRTVFKYVPMEDKNKVRKFSTRKVNALLDLIDNYKEQRNLRCIIMVEEKITAVVLAEMLNELSRYENKIYKADFITGGLFSSVFEQEESKFEQQRLKRIVESFRNHDFNFLVATDVIEEGVDVPSCNVVIKFDSLKDYRSYIQSKGRARFKESEYVILCEKKYATSISEKVKIYNSTQTTLLKTLLTAEGVRSRTDEEEGIDEPEEVFFVKGPDGPHITASQAISFIMRYCNRLPQDKFSFLAPICWYDIKKNKAFLRLPSSSPVKGIIEGDVRKNKKLAKKNVFFKTVKELFKAGEVLEDLSLRSYQCKEEDHKNLFENLIKLSSEKHHHSEASDKRKKYEIEYAKNLSNCMPQPYMESYIHAIKIQPQFPRPEDSRTGTFYDLLCDPNGFAILSSKRLSEICEFPLFLSWGEFKCNLVVNSDTVVLNPSDVENLRKYHFFIFNTVLQVVNRLEVFDNAGEGYSFFVVPVNWVENKPVISWSAINDLAVRIQNGDLNEILTENPTLEDYVKSVVYPKYRQISCTKKYYIVTQLDRSQTPMSTFPSEDFENYYQYFMNKYQLRIRNKEQPLIEVKALPERINYLRPRRLQGFKNKRKYEEDNENFREHLVPELCNSIAFPASFWLKATLLPSALYRITTISHVDDVRKFIASATKLGICNKDRNFSWLPLEVEKQIIQEDQNTSLEWIYNTKQRIMKSQDDNPELQSPVDLFRHMNECAPCDLLHYVKFFGLLPSEDNSLQSPQREKAVTESTVIAEKSVIEVPDLPPFFDIPNEKGPELRDFVKVFTCKSANDIIDLEKLEFLGDSFLKFSAALYVYRNHDGNEGVLVSIKDKIISNKNLYCCGIKKGLQGVLIANEFDPRSGWNAPLFCLPTEIKSLVTDDTYSFDVEYSFEIPVKDKLTGKLNPKAVKAIHDFKNMGENISTYTPDEIVFRRKTILNKSISDCVEALVGLYIKEYGLIGGFKILNWFEILPEPDGTYDELIVKKYASENTGDSTQIMDNLIEMCYEELEKILGYQFKDKFLLLQALTHPSVIDTTVPSYQRLEFLGDAVIDFLVTLYIHYTCPELPPGHTTDIRVNIVNNVTMACIAVKFGFHKYLIYRSPPLMRAINQFVNFQRERNHKVDTSINILCGEGEHKLAEAIEVPKSLGDLFESLAGAIFLDSGNCLRTVWKSYYPLLKDIIELSISDPPKSPIRKLYEWCKPRPQFTYEYTNDGFVVASCKILHRDKEKVFFGKANNKQYSKFSAAKIAVGFLEGVIDEAHV